MSNYTREQNAAMRLKGPHAGGKPKPVPASVARSVCRYQDYMLYRTEIELADGEVKHRYFFAKSKPAEGKLCPLPPGGEVRVTSTGLPYVKIPERA